mmetsp:Transcript_14316/g.24341  ORF Transcript_14316/g.24341 Transcript_14316/m.24341 type:complete len:136 (+) Transcript_14316:159-566(+)
MFDHMNISSIHLDCRQNQLTAAPASVCSITNTTHCCVSNLITHHSSVSPPKVHRQESSPNLLELESSLLQQTKPFEVHFPKVVVSSLLRNFDQNTHPILIALESLLVVLHLQYSHHQSNLPKKQQRQHPQSSHDF